MEERVEKTTMTLDEAIQHCLDKSTGCDECSLEHKQLAEWLRELKELRKYNGFKYAKKFLNVLMTSKILVLIFCLRKGT